MLPVDRLPPQSREAEKGVLGALLRDGIRADTAFGILSATDFYFDAHQKIYRVFEDHAAAGKPFDLVSCFESLRERKLIEPGIDAAYLGELWESVPTGANLEYHAAIVKDRSRRRQLIRLATQMVRDGYEIQGTIDDLLDTFSESLFAANSDRSHGEPVKLEKAFRQVFANIEDRIKPNGTRPIPTGFETLDNVIGGFRPGELTYLGARPSVGKSAIAASFLIACAEEGKSALIFSLEMSHEEFASRILAMRASVNLNAIRGDIGTDRDTVQRLIHAADNCDLPLWIDDRASHTISSISSVARRAVRAHKVGMIVIDYLQLVTPENPRDPRHEQVGIISRKLKLLARTLNIPVVCLCQLNRECESRPDGRPLLSDLRESGNLEQDADLVMLLWPTPFDAGVPPQPVQEIKVCIEKQRNGPRKVVRLEYRRAFTRFEERMW